MSTKESPGLLLRTGGGLLGRFLVVLAGLIGCTTCQSLGASSVTILGPGVINDPKNKSLRFDILKFGLKSFCNEMLTRGAALKLSDDHPVMGRFLSRDCQSDVIDDDSKRTFMVKFSGLGYAWTNVTGRLGFEVMGSVELLPDFQVANDQSMYVYFRPRRVEITQMKIVLVESALARGAAALAGADPDRIGREILEAQLAQGFTVIRTNQTGQIEYGMGLVPLGQHPFHPFNVVSDQPILANDRTEVHNGQQEFLGGFLVEGNGKALSIVLAVDGAPSINMAVVTASAGLQLFESYVHNRGTAALVEPPRYVQNVGYGSLWKQTVPVPAGTYTVLLDHATGTGTQAPASVGDDRAAKVDYLIQLVDAP
jgi:hypothetical protein